MEVMDEFANHRYKNLHEMLKSPAYIRMLELLRKGVEEGTITIYPPLPTREEEAMKLSLSKLTAIEVEILQLAADGYSRKEIAVCRSVSDHTIRNQVNSILAKLQVRGTVHAVAIAFRQGLIK